VVGRPGETRGEVIAGFVVLKNDASPSDELRHALIGTIRRELGPIAIIGELNFVSMLPKTRSGKIMRPVLKAVVLRGWLKGLMPEPLPRALARPDAALLADPRTVR